MSPKASHTSRGFTLAVAAAGIVALSAIVVLTSSFAQTAPNTGTASLERNSDKARKMKEPSFETREERLKAKPLDWNTTIGKPKPRVLTPEEKNALANAKAEASESGKPNPKAEEEARRLHPDDWK